MDLRRYMHVVALADEGSFHRAAERVHLSQPAFSRSIQAAESELGMVLFERGGRSLRCTPAGSFVVERMRALLRASANFSRDVSLFRDGLMGDLRLGMGPFPASRLLPPLLAEMRKNHPGLRVQVHVQNATQLLVLLRRQQLEVVVCDARFTAGMEGLQVEQLGRVQAGFYVRDGHPLLLQERVRMADVAAHGLATGRLPSSLQRELQRLMGIADEEPFPAVVECDDLLALKAITAATDAVMVGSAGLLAAEVSVGTFRLLPVADLPAELSLAHPAIVSLQETSFSPVGLQAVAFLRSLMASLKEAGTVQ
ncbi:MAG TPA: LysR family transcriptional regulator [Ramlibacter sp.]|nr:LysR family transcriptional regulator [Ramlibacter sp.]